MKSFPARALSSLERRLFSVCERFNLRPGRKKDPAELRALSLLHFEIHTDGFADAFTRRYPKDKAALIKEANESSYLGQESAIPWHQDTVTGFSWDAAAFYADIRFGNRDGADIKNPWERSRCHHLLRLGQAYALTQDEKYAQSFVLQVSDWIGKNPRSRGVNWVSPMEIAIRACNWLLAWDFFRESASITEGFEAQLRLSLADHGAHIAHRLEHGGKNGTNHYIANLLGLAYIGVALDNEKWTMLAERELEKEIQLQLHDDGMHYEASIGYHRLVAEMFFYFSLLSVRHSDLFTLNDEGFARSLDAMFDFTSRLMDARGCVPLIGDNDSGRFHSLLTRDDSDMTYLIGFGRGSIEDSESAWLFGLNPRHHEQGMMPSPHGSSGLIALRQNKQLLVFSAQPNGANGKGHHTHNDKLAVTLSVDGEPIFIDPGTAAYTGNPALRNLFRSTAMHNTVQIDGEEQNRFVETDLFALRNDAEVSVVEHKVNERAVAMHSGYERFSHWVRHGRKVEWRDGTWLIEDKFTGAGEHDFLWNFILGKSVRVETNGERKLVLTAGTIKLEMWVEGTGGAFRVENTEYAPVYRQTQATKRLVLSDRRSLPFSVTFFIRAV